MRNIQSFFFNNGLLRSFYIFIKIYLKNYEIIGLYLYYWPMYSTTTTKTVYADGICSLGNAF